MRSASIRLKHYAHGKKKLIADPHTNFKIITNDGVIDKNTLD